MKSRIGIPWKFFARHRKPSSLKAVLMWGLLAFLLGSLLFAQESLTQESKAGVDAVKFRVKGYIYQRQDRLDEAIKFYKEAIKLNPFYACAYNDLGIAFEQKGMLDKAEKQYLKALEIDPNYTAVHTNLALLYERTQDLEKACYHWGKRVAMGDPSDRWTLKAKERFTQLSLAMAEEKKLKRLAEREKGLAKREKEITRQLKKIARKVKEPKVLPREKGPTPEELEKKAALELAVEMASAKRMEKKARLRAEREKEGEMARFLRAQKALKARINSLIRRAEDYRSRKKFNSALEKFQKVRELDPSYPGIDRLIQETRDALAQAGAEEEAKRQRGELQRQQEKLQREGQRLQKKTGYYFRKGEDYCAGKKYDLALKNYSKVRDLDPGYPNIDALIGEVQEAKLRLESEKERERIFREQEKEGFKAQREKIKREREEAKEQTELQRGKEEELARAQREKIKREKEEERARLQLQRKEQRRQAELQRKKEKELARAHAEKEAGQKLDKFQKQQEKLQREGQRLQKKTGYYFRKGEDYYAGKKYDLALKNYSKVRDLDPGYPNIDALIGEVQEAKAEAERAKTAKQIEKKTKRYYKRGERYYMAGKYQKAVGELEQVLALDPKHHDANRLLGYCRRRLQPSKFSPLGRPEPEPLSVWPQAMGETKPRIGPPGPMVIPKLLPDKVKISTTDLKEKYDILGVVAHRAKKGNLKELNFELEKKAKSLGADYVVQIRYFEYEEHLYGYGTAVKLKK